MDLNIYSDYKENFNHCDTRDFEIKHPIKNIMFDHIDWLRNLDSAGKLRPCVLLNIERMFLCKTVYLGYDRFECPYCVVMSPLFRIPVISDFVMLMV